LGLSEALLGVVAALAADSPEITSSISALSQHQRTIGAGVVIGSNVFNLAALLGLGAVVSGFIALYRRVVVLGGFVAMWTAACCLATTTGAIPTIVGLVLAGVVLVSYFVILGLRRNALQRLPLPRRWLASISSAVDEEELELVVAIRPPQGTPHRRGLGFRGARRRCLCQHRDGARWVGTGSPLSCSGRGDRWCRAGGGHEFA
jgi:hypothetical protein